MSPNRITKTRIWKMLLQITLRKPMFAKSDFKADYWKCKSQYRSTQLGNVLVRDLTRCARRETRLQNVSGLIAITTTLSVHSGRLCSFSLQC